MDEKLNGAIEVLLERLREKEQEVIQTKKMINSLRQMGGETPLFSDAQLQDSLLINPSRPDLYYGKSITTASREYLELRKQACQAEEIQRGLEQGGFDFDSQGWKEKDRLRNLSILLAKNSSIFHRLPNGTFGLLAWYPDVKHKSERKKPQEVNGGEQKKSDIVNEEKQRAQKEIAP